MVFFPKKGVLTPVLNLRIAVIFQILAARNNASGAPSSSMRPLVQEHHMI